MGADVGDGERLGNLAKRGRALGGEFLEVAENPPLKDVEFGPFVVIAFDVFAGFARDFEVGEGPGMFSPTNRRF